tara:strand:+ start:973 stop:1458 length:486 start_codon:yes stop_codon:yes gene_type:complete
MKKYRPLPDYLTIKESQIEGLGLYTKQDIMNNSAIGLTHIKDDRFEGGYIRTPLGGFVNHSERPNCEWSEKDGIITMKSIRDIRPGEELTLKYKWYNVEKSQAHPNGTEDDSDDGSIFGNIGTSQYKELIEGYQKKSGEEFNKWYSTLNKEERVFLSNLFD